MNERVDRFFQAVEISKISVAVILKKARLNGSLIQNSTVMRWKSKTPSVPTDETIAAVEQAFVEIAEGRLTRINNALALFPKDTPEPAKDE